MIPEPPPGQEPIDPQGAFTPPPPVDGAAPVGPSGNAPGAPNAPQAGPLNAGSGAQMRAAGPPAPVPPPPPGANSMYPMMPYPFPPPRKSRGLRILLPAMILIVLAFSLLINAYYYVAGRLSFASSSGSRPIVQTILSPGDSGQKIAVIPLHGVITESTATRFHQYLQQAADDTDVKAIILDIDTPGGEVTPSDEMNHQLTEFRRKSGKPVVVSMGSLATSGGYYVACAAQYIFAEPTTLTGNIGVIARRYNLHDLAQKVGVTETTITAPEGGFKNAGSMFATESPRDDAYMQGLIDSAYARFKDRVQTGRVDSAGHSKLTATINNIANGKAYFADEALKLGLIDKVGYQEDAIAKAAKLVLLNTPEVVQYGDATPRLLDLIAGQSNLPPRAQLNSAAKGLTINGINVTLDADSLRDLMTPRPMYLYDGR